MKIKLNKSITYNVLWIYFLVLAINGVVADDEPAEESNVARVRSCRSIFNRPGSCVKLQDCKPFVNILRELPLAGRRVVFASLCSSNKRSIRVCCPASDANNESNNSSEQGSTSENDPASGSSSSSGAQLLKPPQCGYSDSIHNKVVGGVASVSGAWPWLTNIGYIDSSGTKSFRCGGSLVSSRHVLTAGHCVHGLKELKFVRLGEHNIFSSDDGAKPIDVLIEKATLHPAFNARTLENDIAILRLSKDIEFTDRIHPICLPISDGLRNDSFVDKMPFVAGWGAISSDGPTSAVPREVQVPVVDTAQCKKDYSRVKDVVIDNRVLCAGYPQGGKDACQGDSGGPLMYPRETTWYLIGIVSGGYGCAEPNFPGIYTRVTYYLDFIKSNLN